MRNVFLFVYIALYSISQVTLEADCVKLTLEQAEIMALNNNPVLQESKYRSKADYWFYLSELSRLFPTVNYLMIDGRSDSQPETSIFMGEEVSYHQETLRFDQLLFSLPTYYETRSFNYRFDASFFNYLEEILQTLSRIRIAHYRVVAARQLISVYQRLLDLFKESYEQEEIRLSVGETTQFENIRNRLAYTNTLTDYYRAVAEAETARSDWLRILGAHPNNDSLETYDVAEKEIDIEKYTFIQELFNRINNLSTQIRQFLFSDCELFRWMRAAAYSRPVVKRFKAEYRSADMRVKGAWGAYAPEVRFFYNEEKRHPPEYFGTKDRFHDYGIQLNWTLFDSFGRYARIRQTRAEREIAKWNTRETLVDVQLEVRDRTAELEQSLYTVISARQANFLSEEGIAHAKELVAQGELTLLEYRDMVQSLGRAEIDLVQSNFTLAASYFGLLSAVGLQNRYGGVLLIEGCGFDE